MRVLGLAVALGLAVPCASGVWAQTAAAQAQAVAAPAGQQLANTAPVDTRSPQEPAVVQDDAKAAEPAAPIVSAVKQRLSERRLVSVNADERAAIGTFYEKRNGPLWTDGDGLSAKAKAVLAELKRADDWGLPASELVPARLPADGASLSLVELGEVEALVSAAVLKYARYARGGRIPEPSKQLATYIDRQPQLIPPAMVLDALSANGDVAATLRGFNPQHPAFEALRKAYIEAQQTKANGSSDEIGDGQSLRPGMRHPHVAIVRRLLKVPAADVDGKPGDADAYEGDIVEAVRAFQAARGLEPADGIVGRKTRSALNTLRPPTTRELLVNMEQWRWMPADLGETHIAVNVPEFTVRVVKNGTVVHTERVVTGLVDNQTPIFSDALQTVVLNPDWVLPESIKVKEAIPSLLGQGDMFWSNGLKIKKGNTPVDPRSVDWFSANQKAYTFYQPPGDRNVLGQVKFLFPNKHAVYMHDTPSKHLFEKAERAFSHGCMRVSNPVRLAELVLEHDKGWDGAKVGDLLANGPEDNRVALDRKIPVHVTYFTVTTDETGKLRSFKDIYGHAKRISLALDGRWGEIDIPPDHLAPIEDREFEWRAAALERRRAVEERYYYKKDPVNDFFKSLFGGY